MAAILKLALLLKLKLRKVAKFKAGKELSAKL